MAESREYATNMSAPQMSAASLHLSVTNSPDNPRPTIPDLKTLLNELASVKHKWQKICIQLGISNSKFHEFKENGDPFIEGLDYWLKGNTDVSITWESVVAVVESPSVEEPGLAKTLRERWIDATDKKTGPIMSPSQEALILEGSRGHSIDGVETSPIVSTNGDTGHSIDGVEASSVISSNSDTVPDHKTLLNELASVKHKWHKICIQLGISNSKFHEFKENGDPFIEGLDYWLKGNTGVPITWESVVAAMESPSVEEPELAKTLREKWIDATDKKTGPVTSSSQEAFILEGSRSHSMDGVETSPIVSSNRDTGHSTDGVEASSVISSNSDTGGDVEALFPYLSTDMKPHERDNLIYRLKDETSKIQDHFISLVICLKKTLEQSERSSKDVIEVLAVKHPNLKTVFKKCKTIDKIFKKGWKYWSYFDYEPIQSLITCLFDEKHDLRTRLTKYFEHFKSYASRRVAECPSNIHGKREKDEKVLVFKIEEIAYQKLTVNDLKLLCFRLNSAISSYHLSLLSTSDSCIQLTFRTNLQREDKKFELSKEQHEALRDVGVISVSYGDQEYNLKYSLSSESQEVLFSPDTHDVFEMQVKKLQKDFNEIVDNIICCKKFETDEFLANLVSLPIEHRDIHEQFFKNLYTEIEEYKNMSSIWHRLSPYWDFSNYTLIENLVEKFGDNDLISRMQDYKKDLKEFRHKTRLCDFAKYHTEQVMEGDLKEFVIKLKQCWEECTLEDLEKLKKNITHKFFLPSFLMTIRTFGNNFIIVKWVIPSMIATSLKRNLENTDIREFCKENGIESIHLDGIEYLYSPSKKYGAYLKDLYSTKEGKNLAPFKLARIKKEEISRREANEFTKNTFRGDQDDVVYMKYHMTEDELCCPAYITDWKKPRLILIEGAPGVGKTTFSEQYCYKWSQGECLNDHTLLVLLPLRDNSVRSAKSVSELFLHPQLTQDITQEVLKSQGEGLALWLEAWDELEESMREESSLFLDFVHGRVLPKATVIVTGRPWATKKIRDNSDITVDQHIEIVSTPKIQFSRVLSENKFSTENRNKFIDYVNSNPSVKAVMHTPITANIVAEVFQWSQDTESLPPTTMTKLYTAYTCKLLMAHLSRDCAFSCKLQSLKDVPTDVGSKLKAICQLAWEGIVEQKLIFTSDAVSVGTLGLMDAVKELYSEKDCQLSYHFIHLTLQEFLSAYHISQLSLGRQQQVIQEHVKVGHLKTVVRFYFGLCKHDDFTSSMISNSISQSENSCYHWLFETDDPKQISNVLGSDKSVYVHSSYEWSPLDYYCLGYCISHSQCQWELNFSSASMVDEDMEMFCNGTLSNRQATWNGKITEANFHDNEITEEGIKSLVKVSPQMLKAIVKLQLGTNKLNAEALDVFSTVIPKLSSLQVLSVSRNPIGNGGAVELISILSDNKTPLRYLDLDETGIGEEDCASLTILISSTDLEKLGVSFNYLSSNSVTSIMNGILQNNTIKSFRMRHSHFSVDNCTSLSSILKHHVCQLRKLVITKCNIDSLGALQLKAGLTHNQSLEVIYISDNPIGDTGAAVLCDAISNNTLLQTLHMSRCKITSEGFIEIAPSLIKNTSIQVLEIRGNCLELEGAKAMSNMIIGNKALKEIDLNDDDSLVKGVDIIISSLQSNTSLEKLYLPSKFRRPADPRVKWWF